MTRAENIRLAKIFSAAATLVLAEFMGARHPYLTPACIGVAFVAGNWWGKL